MRPLTILRTCGAAALLVALAGAGPAVRSAAAQATEATAAADPVEQIRQVEARRYDAMARNDLAALGDLLADDLTYTHSQGVVNTKAQMLASLESGALRYRSVTTDDVLIRVYGDAAVVTGAAVLAVTAGGHDVSVPVRFIAVYARQDGRWRLEAWQSTRRAEG